MEFEKLISNRKYAIFIETPFHLHDPHVFIVLIRHGVLTLEGYALLFGRPDVLKLPEKLKGKIDYDQSYVQPNHKNELIMAVSKTSDIYLNKEVSWDLAMDFHDRELDWSGGR